MKKETVVKILAHSCFLLPGNILSPKSWFFSFSTIFSLFGLASVIFTCVTEFIFYHQFMRDEKLNGAIMRLKHIPIRSVAFCLTEKGQLEIWNETDSEIPSTAVETPHSPTPRGQAHPTPHPTAKPRGQPIFLEQIVLTSYQVLVFAVNVLTRVLTLAFFPTLTKIFANVYNSHEGNSESQNRIMTHMWYRSSQSWSLCEKLYLIVIIMSMIQRLAQSSHLFYFSIVNTGVDKFDVACLLVQIAAELAKLVLSKELVIEVVTFVLLVILKIHVNMISSIISGLSENSDWSDKFIQPNQNCLREEITRSTGKVCEDEIPEMIFMKKQVIVLQAQRNAHLDEGILVVPGRLNSVHGPISRRDNHNYGDHSVSTVFQSSRKLSDKFGPGLDAAERIYSRIDFVINIYFDLMTKWESTAKVTGFITLVLFCELTSTFCFNMYITLDASLKFGLLSVFGICGVMRGIVIVTRLASVCNCAQELQDMVRNCNSLRVMMIKWYILKNINA